MAARAAERAHARVAGAAVDYAEQALTLATAPADRAALHGTAATGAGLTGGLELAWEHYAAASDAYRLLGDDGRPRAGCWQRARSDRFEGEARLGMIRPAGGRRPAPVPTTARSRCSYRRRWPTTRRAPPAPRGDAPVGAAMVLAQRLPDDEALGGAASARPGPCPTRSGTSRGVP